MESIDVVKDERYEFVPKPNKQTICEIFNVNCGEIKKDKEGLINSISEIFGAPAYPVELLNCMKDTQDPGVVGYITSEIPSDLLDYLQSIEIFTHPSASALEQDSRFDKRMGDSRLNDWCLPSPHIYFEAIFHGSTTSSDLPAIHFNQRFGRKLTPAAPIQLRAFVLATRVKNEDWIIQGLKRAITRKKLFENSLLERLLIYVKQEKLFTSIAVQVHWGRPLSGNNFGWHKDSRASLLHMGITIHGKRALHYLQREGNCTTNAFEEVVVMQEPGKVYLSSPTSVLHAPEFTDCSFESRAISIMCRFLCFSDELNFFGRVKSEQFVEAENIQMLQILAEVIKEGTLSLPTIEEVLDMQRVLERD